MREVVASGRQVGKKEAAFQLGRVQSKGYLSEATWICQRLQGSLQHGPTAPGPNDSSVRNALAARPLHSDWTAKYTREMIYAMSNQSCSKYRTSYTTDQCFPVRPAGTHLFPSKHGFQRGHKPYNFFMDVLARPKQVGVSRK